VTYLIGQWPERRSVLLAAITTTLLACNPAVDDGRQATPEPAASDSDVAAAGRAMDESADASDSITVHDVRYDLVDCRLLAIAGDAPVASLATGLRGSCYFVRELNGEPQLHLAGSATTALVMTSTPHEDDKFCDTKIRAVRLDPEHLQVSDDEQNIQSCSRGPHEDKLIAILSENIPK
jgi:hypothetical protein